MIERLGGDWRQEELTAEGIKHVLEHAAELYVIGFNEHHASTCENETDCTGITAHRYRRHAQRITAQINRKVRQLKAMPGYHDYKPL